MEVAAADRWIEKIDHIREWDRGAGWQRFQRDGATLNCGRVASAPEPRSGPIELSAAFGSAALEDSAAAASPQWFRRPHSVAAYYRSWRYLDFRCRSCAGDRCACRVNLGRWQPAF